MAVLTTPSLALTSAAAGMGQIALGAAPARLTAVLGSCVGVSLFDPRSRKAALAHVVLPQSSGAAETPGKFADTAIPEMLRLLAEVGVHGHTLVAKLAGGSHMFGKTGPLQIGENNIRAIHALLETHRIRVAAEHTGGNKGRKVVFDCDTGLYHVEVLGSTAVAL